MGISRTAFETVGGFRTEYRANADVDVAWRVQLAGFRYVFRPDAVVHYRLRASA